MISFQLFTELLFDLEGLKKECIHIYVLDVMRKTALFLRNTD